jgi:hypothetical protein
MRSVCTAEWNLFKSFFPNTGEEELLWVYSSWQKEARYNCYWFSLCNSVFI